MYVTPDWKFARIKLSFQLGELSYSNVGSFQSVKQISYHRNTGSFAPRTALCNKIGKKHSMLCIVHIYTLSKLLSPFQPAKKGWTKKRKISEGQPVLPVLPRLNLKAKGEHCLKQYLLKQWNNREGQGHVSGPGDIGRKPCQILLSAMLLITQMLIQINSRKVNSQEVSIIVRQKTA